MASAALRQTAAHGAGAGVIVGNLPRDRRSRSACLAGRHTPAHPRDLPTHACINYRSTGSGALYREGIPQGAMNMICVTHEMGLAREVADQVWLVGQGRIVETGTPE